MLRFPRLSGPTAQRAPGRFPRVVCGITVTDSLSLKTRELRRDVGSFPSAANCSLWAEGRNRAVLGQHGQTWALVQRRLLRFVFDFIAASKQALRIRRRPASLAASPRLLAAVVHTYPRHGLPEEMTPVVFPSPHPFLFNHSSSTSASAYFRLFCRTRFNSACTC